MQTAGSVTCTAKGATPFPILHSLELLRVPGIQRPGRRRNAKRILQADPRNLSIALRPVFVDVLGMCDTSTCPQAARATSAAPTMRKSLAVGFWQLARGDMDSLRDMKGCDGCCGFPVSAGLVDISHLGSRPVMFASKRGAFS